MNKNVSLRINGCEINKMMLNHNGESVIFRLVPLDGTLDNLMAPAELKEISYNDNSSIDGSRAVITNRRKKKRNVSVMFWMYADNTYFLNLALEAFEDFLIKGGSTYGINELVIPQTETCYRLVFNKFDKYARIGNGTGVANISLNFTEINPANRRMP